MTPAGQGPRASLLFLGLVTAGCQLAGRAEHRPPSGPRYVDVTRAKGLDHVTWCGSPSKDHLLESVGSGAAFADLDSDGDDDIFVLGGWRLEDRGPDGGPRRIASRAAFAFYRNRGDGTFADETARSGLGGGGAWGIAVAAGDIDGDGDLDLHVACFGPDLLFRNLGDGKFEEVGAASGVADPGWGGGSALFDADGDGDLDLYVANYIEATIEEVLSAKRTLVYKGKVDVMAGPFGLPGGIDRFYRNRGDGRFDEASVEAGLEDRAEAYGLGVLAADLDDDGDIDVYVANDSNANYLFRNEGGGRFREIGVVSGAAFDAQGAAQAGMGVAVLDYDRDGTLDLFVTNFADDASTLYRGEGKLFYEDVSREAGVFEPTYGPLAWGVVPLDADLDGQTDLLSANGQIYPQVDQLPGLLPYRQRCTLLVNHDGAFEDGTESFGPDLAIPGSFRGLAIGDISGAGDEDLLLTRIDEPALLLEREDDGTRSSIVVAPRQPLPRWIGARIDVTAAGRTQSRVILSGGSFASQSSMRAIFATGASGAERVLVRFPGRTASEYRNVGAGSVLLVEVPR